MGLALAAMTLLGGCAGGARPDSTARPAVGTPEPSSNLTASVAPSRSPAAIAREAAAAVFGFQIDAVDPADRPKLLDEFVQAIGSRLEGMSGTAAEAELIRIVSIGKFRLDDATLLRRLELEAKSMLGIDTPLCASLARGELQIGHPSPRMTGLAEPLSPAERLESVRISIAAIRAEVAGTEDPRQLTNRETTTIVTAIAKASSRTDAARIHDLATQAAAGKTLSDDDACWLIRVPYRAVTKLSDADRLLLSRYILGAMSA